MSFRLFIYYCAAWGAATAYFGWVLGRVLAGDATTLGGATLKGLSLGLLVALGLGILDAISAGAARDRGGLIIRLMLALLIGGVGGLLGGLFGQLLLKLWPVLLILGWALTGLLIGAAPSAYDFLTAIMRKEETRGAKRKLRNGLIGGSVGGFVGGALFLALHGLFGGLKEGDTRGLWSPSAFGFVALGACIGLSVSMTQVLLREASLRVEAGFRPGRQLLLAKPETVIGRAEGCDLGLFGDAAVEKVHAKIKREGD